MQGFYLLLYYTYIALRTLLISPLYICSFMRWWNVNILNQGVNARVLSAFYSIAIKTLSLSTLETAYINGVNARVLSAFLFNSYQNPFIVNSRNSIYKWGKCKWFYLLLYSIALRTLLHSPLKICSIIRWCLKYI